jgi:hypothetical protein
MTEPLPEVYFDTNETNGEHRYPLILDRSRADLARLGNQLHDGVRVRLIMTGDLACLARLERDPDSGCWVGVAEPDSYVDLY